MRPLARSLRRQPVRVTQSTRRLAAAAARRSYIHHVPDCRRPTVLYSLRNQ